VTKPSGRSFEFVDAVTSDLVIRARAASLAELFTAAAEALLAATVEEPDAVRGTTQRSIELEARELDLLLVRFLNELVFLRDADALLLRPAQIEVTEGPPARLVATLVGEPLDRARHRLGCEVKAATAHGLRVARSPSGFEAEVTLDV
jgi:SHS2 domain-containing protein